jgi:hypothetical protein
MSYDERNNDYPIWSRLLTLEAFTDLDTLQRPGFYAVPQPVNGPIANVDVFVAVLSANIGGVQRIVQIVNEAVNGRSYTRVRTDNGFSTWNWDNPSPQTGQLTANLTLYVRTDGSDFNTGLANTAAGALRTVTKAIAVVKALDLNRKTVVINVGAGDYSSEAQLNITDLKNPVPSGFNYALRIIGAVFDVAQAPNYKLPFINVQTNNTGALVEIIGISAPGATFTNTLGQTHSCVFTGPSGVSAVSDAFVRVQSCNHAPDAPASCTFFVQAQSGTIDLISATLVGSPTYSNAVLALNNSGAQRRSEIMLGSAITGTATGKQYSTTSSNNNARLSAYSSYAPGNPTSDTDLFTNLPGTAPPYASETSYDLVYNGLIPGALTARDYDLLFELPSGYRIEYFGARCKTGTATCQLRVAGNGVAQGTAIGSTFSAAAGTPTSAPGVNNKCGGRSPGFTLTVSGSPTGTDLHWEMRLKRVFANVAG